MNNAHIFNGQGQFFGHNLGDDRIGTLTHVRGAGEDIGTAIVIQLDDGATAV